MRGKPRALQGWHQCLVVYFWLQQIDANKYSGKQGAESEYPFVLPTDIHGQTYHGQEERIHNLVSPMVRSGGRSSDIHIAAMKTAKQTSPHAVSKQASVFRPCSEPQAPHAHKTTAGAAKYII